MKQGNTSTPVIDAGHGPLPIGLLLPNFKTVSSDYKHTMKVQA